jgi:hypothetical protein
MSFTSSNLISPDKDIKKAKKTLLNNVRAIIQYNMATTTAKDETTLAEGIEYLKFVEKNDTVFIRKDRVLKLERKAKKITIGFPSKSVATEIEKEILSQLFNINKKLNLYFTNEKIYIELISIVNVESLRNHSISTGERKFELND